MNRRLLQEIVVGSTPRIEVWDSPAAQAVNARYSADQQRLDSLLSIESLLDTEGTHLCWRLTWT